MNTCWNVFDKLFVHKVYITFVCTLNNRQFLPGRRDIKNEGGSMLKSHQLVMDVMMIMRQRKAVM